MSDRRLTAAPAGGLGIALAAAALLLAPAEGRASEDLYELARQSDSGAAASKSPDAVAAAIEPRRKQPGGRSVRNPFKKAPAAQSSDRSAKTPRLTAPAEPDMAASVSSDLPPTTAAAKPSEDLPADMFSLFAAGEPGAKPHAATASLAPNEPAVFVEDKSQLATPRDAGMLTDGATTVALPAAPSDDESDAAAASASIEHTQDTIAEATAASVDAVEQTGDLAALYGGFVAPAAATDTLSSPGPADDNADQPEDHKHQQEQPEPIQPLASAFGGLDDPEDIALLAAAYAEDVDGHTLSAPRTTDAAPFDDGLPMPSLDADATGPVAKVADARAAAAPTSNSAEARSAPKLRSIYETSVDLTPVAQQLEGEDEPVSTERPEDTAAERFGDYSAAAVGGGDAVRFAVQQYLWASPAMRHKPLYFEQVNLERYGSHAGGNCLASLAATGHFVASTVSMPYQLAAQPPSECVYTLGVYRPGSCAPHFFHLSPCSGKGLAAQGAAVTGLVLLFP